MATTPPSTTSANGTNLNAAPNTPPAAPQKTNPTVSRVFLSLPDPLRAPVAALLSLSPGHPIGSIYDKILIGVLRLQA